MIINKNSFWIFKNTCSGSFLENVNDYPIYKYLGETIIYSKDKHSIELNILAILPDYVKYLPGNNGKCSLTYHSTHTLGVFYDNFRKLNLTETLYSVLTELSIYEKS